MADNPLLQALLGVNVTPQETLFGQGAQTMGTLMPNVYSPYVSPGRNLASIAGAGLLAGLMGYAAKREAEAENRALAPQLSAILSAQTPEELNTLAGAEGFPSRLMPLAQQMMLQRLTQQQTAAEKAAEAKLAERKTALEAFGTLTAKYPTTEGLNTLREAAGLPPLSGTGSAVELEFETPEDRRSRLEKEIERTEKQQNKTSALIQNVATHPSVVTTLALEKVYKNAKQIQSMDSAAAADSLKKLLIKSNDIASTITLPEFGLAERTQGVYDKYIGILERASAGKSDLTPEARQEMVNVIDAVRTAALNETQKFIVGRARIEQKLGSLLTPKELMESTGFTFKPAQTDLDQLFATGEKLKRAKAAGALPLAELQQLEEAYRVKVEQVMEGL